MANVALGVRRPSDIARRLGVSRQAIHATIIQMAKLGIVELANDPTNRRVKVVALTAQGEAMRADAQKAMVLMGEALFERFGRAQVLKTAHLLGEDWGPPLTFGPPEPKAGG
ncbi:MarR family winged helix-turn-helix transcriptional regulator [Phenylobacterium sp. J367]|uniref:MarR family winged helix-turn-helix transcriptional regulator n=1 Tax=Phenylobacterium sp. J367 TaxID=2898435 RepID=UPI0035B3C46B